MFYWKPVVRKTSDVVNYILSNSLVLFFLYFSNLSKFVSSQPNVNLSLTVWVCVAFVLHAKKRKRSFFQPEAINSEILLSLLLFIKDEDSPVAKVYIYSFLGWKVIQGVIGVSRWHTQIGRIGTEPRTFLMSEHFRGLYECFSTFFLLYQYSHFCFFSLGSYYL